MVKRGIPLLELELEYCEQPSGQTKTRIEAFLEILQNRASAA
jgi:benzoyl-CoA reductase/2-hydroxyglutaryl-CoA dehydratase subunit BcrC/BadD/HgdB